MDSLISKSIGIIFAVGLGFELATSDSTALPHATQSANLNERLLDKCCQVGRERAIESARFNCKLSAREVFAGPASSQQPNDRASQLVALGGESLLARDPNFGDQCEMVLESCCLAHHRTRNCNSGKQFAKSGSACMDVELSKEATVATESFNDCCMSCSLGILAARTPATSTNETSSTRQPGGSLNERCKLISPLAASLSGQLYEQTYNECCQENLPRVSSALTSDSSVQIDCSQANNVCSQRCLPAGSQDPVTRRPLDRDRCDCFTGYKLASDGLTCFDVDECKLNLHTCNKQSEVCDNTRGSFRCLARSSNQQQQQQLSQGRPLTLGGDQAFDSAAAFRLVGEQPFASFRLCPPGSRWLANESRCVTNVVGEHQQQWKRNAVFSSSSSSISTSSRRSSRASD